MLDSRRAGPLQLEIKKEGQKLGGSTTPVGNQAKTSSATIIEVSKNLFLMAKARKDTNNGSSEKNGTAFVFLKGRG